jgi:phosphoribosylaminoimidazolecarboxamide formyltransferase/IMP cyclohydrolase
MTDPATETQQERVDGQVRVRRALISVSDKTGVADFAKGLAALGVEILSTGGTATALREAGLEVTDVSEFTGQEEILDGRVKTLHPRLHAALLARRDDPEHVATLEREGIEPIDLVCVNLYPFEQTVSGRNVAPEVVVENIDIGGPTMIRAAAKNHSSVAVIVKPESYDAVCAELEETGGEISLSTRHWLANEAFAQTARYDAAISRWFSTEYEDFPEHLAVAYEKVLDLSYGENPHQRAALYSEVGLRSHILSRVSKLHGRALSFNNVLDLDSARALVGDFEQPACVIVKHNNPCGVAIGADALEAYLKALACDPISAYGGVIAINRPIGRELAEELHKNFVEVLSAPGYEDGALEVLQQKEAIRILCEEERRQQDPSERDVKRVMGGLLIQDRDGDPEPREIMEAVTGNEPSEQQWQDMLFAWTVCRRVRSNAIVLAKDGAALGIGAGQMSRVDSVRLAVEKCREARGVEAEGLLSGSALASDAFFPFADGPELAIQAGATAVIQPGGSKRDAEVIEACEKAGVAMVFTKHRHFRHFFSFQFRVNVDCGHHPPVRVPKAKPRGRSRSFRDFGHEGVADFGDEFPDTPRGGNSFVPCVRGFGLVFGFDTGVDGFAAHPECDIRAFRETGFEDDPFVVVPTTCRAAFFFAVCRGRLPKPYLLLQRPSHPSLVSDASCRPGCVRDFSVLPRQKGSAKGFIALSTA